MFNYFLTLKIAVIYLSFTSFLLILFYSGRK